MFMMETNGSKIHLLTCMLHPEHVSYCVEFCNSHKLGLTFGILIVSQPWEELDDVQCETSLPKETH